MFLIKLLGRFIIRPIIQLDFVYFFGLSYTLYFLDKCPSNTTVSILLFYI